MTSRLCWFVEDVRQAARLNHVALLAVLCVGCTAISSPAAEPSPKGSGGEPAGQANAADRQAKLEADFARLLTGATLEGSYTSTGRGDQLSQDKYTLGNVKKVGEHMWLFEARIQYEENDVTLPITVPVRWAGDTPVIVVDKLGLPEFGTVSARVMFSDRHYAGYWKHGQRGGHLFGVIKPKKEEDEAAMTKHQ